MKEKVIIYQVLPRLFGNDNTTNKHNGTLEENGVGKFSHFDDKALKEIKSMGFSHIWYTGVLEHGTKTDYSKQTIKKYYPEIVKGTAGSPYAIRDYYDVCPDYATDVNQRMQEFEALIKRTHDSGLKLIIDFVPNHVARDYQSDKKPKGVKDLGEDDDLTQSFATDNNFYYLPNQHLELDFADLNKDEGYDEFPAKATGNNVFSNNPSVNDWYETVKLNYGVNFQDNTTHFDPIPNTWKKMRDILLFWTKKGIDGFRCDMAEMVPVEFWEWVTKQVKAKNKKIIFIGETYNPDEYHTYIHRGGFDYLYDKVTLYDALKEVICGRKPTSDITFCWQKVEGLQYNMLNFLENHDEQRIASDFFAGNAQKAIPAFQVSAWMNTNPVMLYFGQELGEKGMDEEGFSGRDGRTTIFDYWSVDSVVKWRNGGKLDGKGLTKEQKALRKQYIEILQMARDEKCMTSGGFYDLMYANYENDRFDSTRQYAFLRFVKDELLLVVSNFSDQKADITVNIPSEAFEYIQINPEKIKKTQIIFGKKSVEKGEIDLAKIALSIPANDGVILKLAIK